MMMLEKKLAQTDLSKYQKSPKERFAEQICLYRKFKTKDCTFRTLLLTLPYVTC